LIVESGPDADVIKPVFVAGCPRSGTTLVGNLLAAADTAFNGEESFFLQLMSYWKAMLNPPIAPPTHTF
jgi:LPS sulfotransferase NodH